MSSAADHVFPREIFRKHQRNCLPKVPSCAKCNNEKSKLEHYLLSVLPFGATHANAKKTLAVDVARRLKRNRKLHKTIRRGFGYSYIPRQGNILERTLNIKFDSNVLHEFVGFVGRGLMWHHWGKHLPLDCTFQVFTPSPTGMRFISELFGLATSHRVDVSLGGDTVRYKGVMSEKDDGVSVWAIQLFGGMTISDKGHSHIFKNSFVAMITGSPSTIDKLKMEEAI